MGTETLATWKQLVSALGARQLRVPPIGAFWNAIEESLDTFRNETKQKQNEAARNLRNLFTAMLALQHISGSNSAQLLRHYGILCEEINEVLGYSSLMEKAPAWIPEGQGPVIVEIAERLSSDPATPRSRDPVLTGAASETLADDSLHVTDTQVRAPTHANLPNDAVSTGNEGARSRSALPLVSDDPGGSLTGPSLLGDCSPSFNMTFNMPSDPNLESERQAARAEAPRRTRAQADISDDEQKGT